MTFLKGLFGKKDQPKSNMKIVEEIKLSDELTESGLSAGFFVNDDPAEELISSLGKQATQHKKNKEWDEAINCLIRVQELMSQTGTSYTIQKWLRLPKYYMYAERYDEALAECSKFIHKILKEKKTRFEVKEFTNRDFVEVEKAYWLMSEIAYTAGDTNASKLYSLNAIFYQSAGIRIGENLLIHTEEDMLECLDSILPEDYSREDIIKLWAKSLMHVEPTSQQTP
ncbi:hypothetical protein VH441_07245 [Psychrobacter sp. HD31]|uniref:hypothetical protein n=1 Tax=Psychrobacter sp. HD31 TaxID=3112003 RepID=UPI003DA3B566